MGNFLNVFSPKPKPVVVEDEVDVFETNPTAKIILVDVDDEPNDFKLN